MLSIKIRELKEIITSFDDNKEVSVFLKLTSNFGILYEVEDWGNNNGHLDLWIYDTTETMREVLKDI